MEGSIRLTLKYSAVMVNSSAQYLVMPNITVFRTGILCLVCDCCFSNGKYNPISNVDLVIKNKLILRNKMSPNFFKYYSY